MLEVTSHFASGILLDSSDNILPKINVIFASPLSYLGLAYDNF